ncbi:phosphopentothenoylcysteine decarboxylase-like protein [Tricladium varicosporioides]|nr:phosphopentothenoylcysteine decarboxylase-like protein [Hymenoscyphus varicosporioides]
MEEHPHSLRSRFLQSLPKSSSSSSSLADMRITESPKLRVLVCSNGGKDVAQALALVVRLSKNPRIETRAIVDEESFPAHRLCQETLTVPNKHFQPCTETDEARKSIEWSQVEFYKQQAYELCDWADMMVLAPIDADTFAKMLHGIADCFLLEILRGWDVSKKILLVPGMTTSMWENPMTKKQLSKVRRKWQWVRVMQPILWHYDDDGPHKCLLAWDGFNELVEVIKNQAELMTIGHDVDIATHGLASIEHNTKTDTLLPPEIWSVIFEYVGDWEVARAVNVYTKLPTPSEWQRKPKDSTDKLQIYMRSLEWTILTSPVEKIIEQLKAAPENMQYLSSLCVKLIIKFCLTEILTYLETNLKDVFWSSFGQKLLPNKASAVYGRTEILEWWRTSPTFLSKDYTAEAIDGASKSSFVHVLDWWRHSGLPLKYTESAMEQASSQGHLAVLEWWKQAGIAHGTLHNPHSPTENEEASPNEGEPALRLKPGKALLAAAQNNQPLVLRWWDQSGIPIAHSESVAKIASAHGHVAVLDVWKELKGEKMAFDSRVLVEPTKNGHVDVLEWWKEFSRSGVRVEYKTCDIEEALEDSVGSESETFRVKKWWALNGLNLGVQVSLTEVDLGERECKACINYIEVPLTTLLAQSSKGSSSQSQLQLCPLNLLFSQSLNVNKPLSSKVGPLEREGGVSRIKKART